MKIIHHPNQELIRQFAHAQLSSLLNTMVSAHLELCQQCRSLYEKELLTGSEVFSEVFVKNTDNELDIIFELLMNRIDSALMSPKAHYENASFVIDVSGSSFRLPQSLKFIQDKTISWKEFGKKNAIAPISTSLVGNFYLIYIGPGESVPEHSHTNQEYSYVVSGSYEDRYSSYSTGDFTCSKNNHLHTPTATSQDGCLVVSWVEGRLNYFKGIFSPLNRLLWWYLHRA